MSGSSVRCAWRSSGFSSRVAWTSLRPPRARADFHLTRSPMLRTGNETAGNPVLEGMSSLSVEAETAFNASSVSTTRLSVQFRPFRRVTPLSLDPRRSPLRQRAPLTQAGFREE